ncbi:Acetyl-CoA hydrolase [Desulfonema limicola]|uniref:Acetyl-CoA hydrolase n=1 Tax=Desulfonema limicola TaxID=45656 RepID=A0A975B680_9BACT|nr:bifunctional acetyl-CoA hydrolase/transferase family protein/GNAT family N-acetyltransferase [Desulfonema limicola]QTA79490.1 Acetyl-CoA hydrolase [Desulfonema limicola]
MNMQKCPPQKLVSAEQAISNIKKGSRVFIGSGCGEPRHLIHALARNKDMQEIMIYQMLSFTLAEYMDNRDFLKRFSLKLFFISASMRKAAFEGKIDYIPAYLSEIPELFDSNQIGLDAALIQISPPDKFGYCSLGISVDVTQSGCRNAKMVIAQVNPKMPRTWGDSFVHIDEIDWFVPFEEPLINAVPDIPDKEVASRIGFYVSELIEDGVTLQIGFGRLPYMILQCLDKKHDLGIHTQMITDAFIPLFENGNITNTKKNLMPGRAVATLCMGSEKIYDYVDNNPKFYFRSSDFVNNPAVAARNDNLVSISSALEVDLTGQVCADSVGYLFYSGIGDQANFIRGAAMSKGGFSIIALPSTAKNGTISRIVPTLSQGAGVATLRGDVNFVVTEYGIAQLRGKSIYQRVMELAQIAHPDFRSSLVESAKNYHYIFSDQLAPISEDLIFTERYKTRITLKNGKSMSVRPILPTDEFAYRNFFYSLLEETVYYRFFHKITLFTHEMAQDHWSSLDYRKNISLIGMVRNKGHKEIIAIGSYAESDDNRAEVAFVVREDFHGMGIASHLLKDLEKIAKENGYKGFCATVLPDNKSMIKVFQKRFPGCTSRFEEGSIFVIMDFDEQP